MNVCVIMVNYNNSQLSCNCCDSLLKQQKSAKLSIVVVDNDSRKEEQDILKAYIQGKENVDAFIRIASESASYKELFSYYENIGSPVDYTEVESYAKLDRLLDNGLSEEENRRLFHSVNIMEIVSLILKGISNIIN